MLFVIISIFQNHPLEENSSNKDAGLQDDSHGPLDTVYQQPCEETTQTNYDGFTHIELKEKECDCRTQFDFKTFTTELGIDVTTENPLCISGLQNQVS